MILSVPRPTAHSARSAARAMSQATVAVGILLGLGFTYVGVRAVFDRQWVNSLIAANFPGLDPAAVAPSAMLVVVGAMVAQAAVLAIALHAVWRTFDVLARESIFDPDAGRSFRKAGMTFAVLAALKILAYPLTSVALSMNAPAGQRFVSIGLGSTEVLTLFIAGVMVALGHVLSLAAEIDEDNRQIV